MDFKAVPNLQLIQIRKQCCTYQSCMGTDCSMNIWTIYRKSGTKQMSYTCCQYRFCASMIKCTVAVYFIYNHISHDTIVRDI